MINLVITILKANGTLTNLVPDTRIYPLIQLQGGTIPAVVVQLTGTAPNDTQDKVSEYDNNAVEVTSIADNPAEAWAISEAVRGALDGYTGGSIAQIRFTSQATDIFEGTEVFSVTQSYSVHTKRDSSTLPQEIAGLGEFNLDDINDVDTTGVTDGQVISYDDATSTWLASDASAVAALDDLTDVTITTPANNQALVYNSAAGEWRNDQLSLTQLEGISSELGDAIDRQALVYDEASNQWIADGVGQVVIPVRNPSRDDSIAVGTVLKATGSQGDRILVAPFQPTDDPKLLVGIASEAIGTGADGHAQVYGELRNIDTDAYNLGDILYPQADGVLGTTENLFPFAIVTRKQQNTGRIFVRMWVPGKGYHNRYRTEASAEMFVGVGAEVELYYTATADGDGFVTQDLTATPAEGNVEERVLRYKSGAFGDSGTTTGYTDAGLATDATYAEMLTAFNNLIKTESPPLTIYATRTEVADRSGLLADYPGAAAAYSLRLLDSDYAGSAIRVRRASDNTEQDIGFDVGGDLDTSALATFCAGTDGFVKTWYSQTGSNDATQTTTSLQPKVYDSAAGVVLENGKPMVQAQGNSNMILSASNQIKMFVAGQVDNSLTLLMQFDPQLSDFGRWCLAAQQGSPSGALSESGVTINNFRKNGATYSLSGVTRDDLYNDFSSQNVMYIDAETSATTTQLLLGYEIDYAMWSAHEVIIYPTSMTHSISDIETNINDYYSIYTP